MRERRLHYFGYASARLPENLEGQDRDMKCAVYAVTLTALDHPGALRLELHRAELFSGGRLLARRDL